MKPSTLLKDVTFDFEEDEESLGPHIALTFDFQGGAASGHNKPLLFKSDKLEITPELINKLKDLDIDVSSIEKALSYNDLRSLIQSAIEEKEFTQRWDWWYLSDFDDTTAVFFVEDEGMFAVDYTINGVDVQVDDIAKPVVVLSQYEIVDGDVLVSEDARQNLKDELQTLVNKASNNSKVKEKILTFVNKTSKEENSVVKSEDVKTGENSSDDITKNNGEHTVDLKEIFKSEEAKALLKSMVDEAVSAEKAEKEEIKKAYDAAEARLVAVEKAEKARVEKQYTDIVKGFGFVEEEKQSELVKALMAHPEESLIFVEALNKAHSEVEKVKAEFAKEVGSDAEKEIKKGTASRIAELAESLSKNK